MLLSAYYYFKPLIPRRLQVGLRRALVRHQLRSFSKAWPIDETAGRAPEGWRGWPEGKQFALVLTHDVETARGLDRCLAIADIEERLGFRSSFNFVAEDYRVPADLRRQLVDRGFETGLHGLSHDGHLYRSRKTFLEQAVRINRLLKEWDVVGFRSPAMHRNLQWLCDLEIEYDSSTFDTDPFEPYPEGAGTIFPFPVRTVDARLRYMELPYSLPQDFTLFVILQQRTSDYWRNKLDWIASKGGMALLITHPDYMAVNGSQPRYDEYRAQLYTEFLEYARDRYGDRFWQAKPREVARFCAKEIGRRQT